MNTIRGRWTNSDVYCHEFGPGLHYVCTLFLNHEGNHVASNADGDEVPSLTFDEWEQES